MPKGNQPRRRAPTRLPREEWDFRASFLPDDEVAWCIDYERSRELQTRAWRDDIQRFRRACRIASSKDPKAQFDRLLKGAVTKRDRFDWTGSQGLFYALWPEWPDQPYLSVDFAERRRRHRKWTAVLELKLTPLEVFALSTIIEKRDALRRARKGASDPLMGRCWKPLLEMSEKDALAVELAKDNLQDINPAFYDERSHVDIVAFRLSDWLSVRQLTEQFRLWLAKRRKELGWKEYSTRGGASDVKQERKTLCALGAWRLIRVGMSYNQAEIYTAEKSKEALFKSEPSWSRAIRHAKSKLRLPSSDLTANKPD